MFSGVYLLGIAIMRKSILSLRSNDFCATVIASEKTTFECRCVILMLVYGDPHPAIYMNQVSVTIILSGLSFFPHTCSFRKGMFVAQTEISCDPQKI